MDRRSGLRGDDQGQLFLLAGIVLALALIVVTTVVTTNVHTPARQLDAQRPVALQGYDDVKDKVRESVQYHLSNLGATNESVRAAVQRLGDPTRLGVVDRDVDTLVRMNGTYERSLCNEATPYSSVDLEEFAEKTGTDCSHPANADGVIVSGDGRPVAAVVEVGLIDTRYSVRETLVVTSIPDRFYLRRATNVTVGATVDDGPTATDFSDGVFHQVRSPNPNVPSIAGYAAIPHSMYAGALDVDQDRKANWSVAVANPSEKPIDVHRVEIVEVDGNSPWESDGIETMIHPESDWSIQQSDTVTSVIDNADFSNGRNDWNDTYKDVDQADEYGTRDDTICQDLRDNNDCLKLKTEVTSDENDADVWYTANQTFTAPDFDEAKISFDYNLDASDPLQVDQNMISVSVIDSDGNSVYSFEDTSKTTLVWTAESEDLTSDLVPGETYNVSIEGSQKVPSKDLVDPSATSWIDDVYVNFTTINTQRLVWNGSARTIPSSGAANFSVQVTSDKKELTDPADLTFRSRVRANHSGEAKAWYELDAADAGGRSRPYETVRGDTKPTVTVAMNQTGYTVDLPKIENSGFEDGNTSWTHEHAFNPDATVHGVQPCPARPPIDNHCVAAETTVDSDGSKQSADYWLNQTFTTPPSFTSASLEYDRFLDSQDDDVNELEVEITDPDDPTDVKWGSGSHSGSGWVQESADVEDDLDPQTVYALRIHGHHTVPAPASGSAFANVSIDDVFVNFTRDQPAGSNYEPTWSRPVEASSTVSLQFVVDEASNAVTVPDHKLDIYVPDDWEVASYHAGDCSDPCYQTPPTTIELDGFGTIYRFDSKATGFAPDAFGTLTMNVTAPGVGTPSLYRFPLQVRPLDTTLTYPYARSDAILQVVPSTSTPHTMQFLYHSEDVLQDLDKDQLRGLEVGVDASANRRMDVELQLWNETDDGWAWRTLEEGVVDFQGVTWRSNLRIDGTTSETRLGVMDSTGTDEIDVEAKEDTIAIRFVHASDQPYRFNVDLAYYRIEHV